jgi:hypothetical protein
MKKKLLKFFAVIFLFMCSFNQSYSQFDKPVLQIGIGISEPMSDMKGTYYNYSTYNSYPVISVNSDFMTNNMGAKTGFNIFGKGKINFDKYNILRGTAAIGFSTFNTFEPSKTGNILIRVRDINGNIILVPSSASFNYTLNNFNLGIGLEVAPIAFTNVISPYFGANITFNSFNGKLSRTENRIDSVTFSFSDFRIGASLDAGIEAKFSKVFGIALGVRFDLGNLLLKNTNSDIASRIEWGKTNGSMNDENGTFYSGIYSPIVNDDIYLVNSKKKNLNWGTIYLAANIYFDTKSKPKGKQPNPTSK